MREPSQSRRVAVFGGASWNTILHVEGFPAPRPGTCFPTSWHETVGSSGAGKALNLARLGVSVTFCALLGDDPAGAEVRRRLVAAGVDFRAVRDPSGTARHVNLMDPVGRRISFLAHTGDPAVGLGGDAAERIVAASDIVLVEIVDQARPVLAIAAARGRPIWTDLHDYDGSTAYHEEFLRAAEVVFLSDQALPDPRPFMAAQIQRGKWLVVCTRAEAGALALTADGRWIEVPAEAVPEIVDTNGAGDAFAAGVLFGELGGFPIERSLRFGARAAALSVGSSELASPALTAGVLLGLA